MANRAKHKNIMNRKRQRWFIREYGTPMIPKLSEQYQWIAERNLRRKAMQNED